MSQAEDREIVQEIISSKRELGLVDDKEIDDLPKALRVVKALSYGAEKFDFNGNAAKLYMGSMMLFLQKRPSLWREKYETFEDLAQDKIYGKGFSRALASKYRKVAGAFGKYPLKRIADMTFENVYLIAKHTDQGKPSCDKYLKAAEELDHKALVDQVAKWTGNTKESLRDGSFKVVGTVEQVADLQRFLALPEVHKEVGSDKPIDVLLAMADNFAAEYGISFAKTEAV